MAFKLSANTAEWTSTQGTGTMTTQGSPTGMMSFSTGIGTGNTTMYHVKSGDGVSWETGIGTVTVSSGVTTLSRTTVLDSFNGSTFGTSAISLSGTSIVFCSASLSHMTDSAGLLDQYFTNVDGTYSLKRLSGVWSMVAAGGGSGSGLFSPAMSAAPSQSSTGLNTWMNQGSATETDSTMGMFIQGVASQDWQLLKKAAPSTPYTITAMILMNCPKTSNIGAGIGFTDGTKLHIAHLQTGSNVIVSKWTNTTTFSANDFASADLWFEGQVWLRINDDGTNVKFSWSHDGANFRQVFSVAKASGFLGGSGYTNVFFGANSNTAAAAATLASWAVT
jgi:hypothetical protein